LETFNIVVTTYFGLENILKSEIQRIGGRDIEVLNRAVRFKGNQALLYKSNLHLRTAVKILKPIDSFVVTNEEQLYDKIKQIDWSVYFSENDTFAIDGVATGEFFTHSKYVALKSKDAIADQFTEKLGKRPNVDVQNPDFRINVQISGNNCNVSLDSSGLPLSKRSYRKNQLDAPLNEALAAGLVLLSGWDRKSTFYDPMCGSGTIAIEAVMIARNIAPGRLRSFTFEKWKDFDLNLWNKIKDEAEKKIIPLESKVYAHDIDLNAIRITALNAQNAGIEEDIEIDKNDFINSDFRLSNATLVINPPYGERLNEKEDLVPFYKEIGTKLKHFYENSNAWILSSNFQALKFIGLKPSKKVQLFNGNLDCRFCKYELYKGSKKIKNQ